jgi:hypothetical protein
VITPGTAAGATPDAGSAQRVAHEILTERRFAAPPLPEPLRKPLNGIDSLLTSLGHTLDRVGNALAPLVPGGAPVGWALLALAVVLLGVAAFTGARMARRGSRARSGAAVGLTSAGGPDAAALEREADAAERAGDAAAAVRLRFQAGLLELERRELISQRASLCTGELARRLRLNRFDELARRFDEIAYGGRTARESDAHASREGWRALLAEVDSR